MDAAIPDWVRKRNNAKGYHSESPQRDFPQQIHEKTYFPAAGLIGMSGLSAIFGVHILNHDLPDRLILKLLLRAPRGQQIQPGSSERCLVNLRNPTKQYGRPSEQRSAKWLKRLFRMAECTYSACGRCGSLRSEPAY